MAAIMKMKCRGSEGDVISVTVVVVIMMTMKILACAEEMKIKPFKIAFQLPPLVVFLKFSTMPALYKSAMLDSLSASCSGSQREKCSLRFVIIIS